ncbi:SIMPL domain-containing protein [Selenomonas ruminantium]|uniref:SIMPL domain-containing protein n=1 Tax=Selenomonas ruminantium TaxID=971 RepID=A0A1I0YD67_SELRU|nr:SIMPL domain-containing protein [Selenomonas ruminantium]SFB10328.1 hypothetical protein SAMN05216587_11157 [Selenomonas ruminantium]
MINQEPYIQVKGVGRVKRTPDTIEVSLYIKAKDPSYSEAVENAAKQVQLIQSNITSLGFKKEDLKTRNFDIDQDYEDTRTKDGDYIRHFLGYKVTQSLSLSFPFDMKKLDGVISVLAMSIVNPEVNIGFKISDEDGVKKEILEKATKDAFEKANILCKASNVKLGKLLSIDYSWSEVCFESDDKFTACEAGSANFDMQPDDIRISDTVAFTWELRQ